MDTCLWISVNLGLCANLQIAYATENYPVQLSKLVDWLCLK